MTTSLSAEELAEFTRYIEARDRLHAEGRRNYNTMFDKLAARVPATITELQAKLFSTDLAYLRAMAREVEQTVRAEAAEARVKELESLSGLNVKADRVDFGDEKAERAGMNECD